MGTVVSEKLRPLFVVSISFISFTSLLVCITRRLPSLPEEHREHFKFPHNVDELKNIGLVLSEYQDNYYWQILLLICTVFIFMQSFMIPGSVLCVVLLGYLFPSPVAVIIVALCSAIGASLCYLLVGFIGSRVLMHLVPEKIELCRQTIQRYRHAMFFCICCLRVCPFIPNWLVNISSPIIDVPLVHFFFGTFVDLVQMRLQFECDVTIRLWIAIDN
ncbi:Transmembrane protein 41B [Schistosoma japonicum]|nr:Transmembrane protein 41B [Schistosoma japonicum]